MSSAYFLGGHVTKLTWAREVTRVSVLDVFRKRIYSQSMHSFQEIVEYFGGVTAMAKALDVTTQAISQWDREIPESRAYQIEVLSKGKFRHDRLPVRSRSSGPELRA